MTDIFDQLDQPAAEAWVSQEGDAIAGTVIAIGSRDGGYGEYPIITLEVDPGSKQDGKAIEIPAQRAVHAMATVLKNELGWSHHDERWEDQRIHRGDKLGVKDQGKRQGKGENPYAMYSVVIRKAEPETTDEPAIFNS